MTGESSTASPQASPDSVEGGDIRAKNKAIARAANLNCAQEQLTYDKCLKENRFWYGIPMTSMSNPNCTHLKRAQTQCADTQLIMMKIMGHTAGLDPKYDQYIEGRCDDLYHNYDPERAQQELDKFREQKQRPKNTRKPWWRILF